MGAEERSVKCLLKDSIQVNEKIREMRRNSVWRARVRHPTDAADTQADTQADRLPGRQTLRQTLTQTPR